MTLRFALSTAALAVAALVGGISVASAGGVTLPVPEPMSLGLLAAGAGGLYLLRKLRDR